MSRVVAFDALRVMAAYAVVACHAVGNIWYDDYPLVGWDVGCFTLCLARWCVPMFVAISGALFLDASRPFSIRRLYAKNLLRLVYAYFFWALVFVLLNPSVRLSAKDALISLFRGPSYLWFLKMLMGVYIITPLLREVVVKKQIERYFIGFSFATVFLLPMVINVIGLFNETAMLFVKDIFQTMALDKVIDFSAFFVLGHYLYTYPLTRRQQRALYAAGVVSFVCVIIATYWVTGFTGRPNGFLFDNTSPFTFVEIAAIFVFVKEHAHRLSPSLSRWVVDASACSFGIYLAHPYAMDLVRSFVPLDVASAAMWVLLPLFTLLAFVLSYVLTKVLKRVPYLGRVVI